MKFDFRLEKVLHFVRLKETVKKMELASIAQRVSFLEKRTEEIRAGLRVMLEKHHTQLSAEWVQYHTSKIAFDAHEVGRLEAILQKETAALEKKKVELSRLLYRKKALEALREKRLREFNTHESRRQQRVLDDVYQMTQQTKRLES